MACVDSVIKGVQALCAETHKVGGLDKRVWIGTVTDLASVTYGAANEVTAMTFSGAETMTGTAITLASPGVATVTSTASLETGNKVTITANTGATLVGGLTIVGQTFTITVINATTFSIGAETTGTASTAFTMTVATKGLVKFIGRIDKNSAGSDIEPGENINLRNQFVNMSVYYSTAVQLEAIDQLIDQEQVFAVVETRPGALEVFGISKVNFASYGLKVTANPGTSGILVNDSTAFAMVLSGGFPNLQLKYNEAVALATNIAALDALSIDP